MKLRGEVGELVNLWIGEFVMGELVN